MRIGRYTIQYAKLDPPSGRGLTWRSFKAIYSVLPGYGWQVVVTWARRQWVVTKRWNQ